MIVANFIMVELTISKRVANNDNNELSLVTYMYYTTVTCEIVKKWIRTFDINWMSVSVAELFTSTK